MPSVSSFLWRHKPMAKKKQATAKAPAAPKATAAAKEKDAEPKPHVFRVDLGEGFTQAPPPTATDKGK